MSKIPFCKLSMTDFQATCVITPSTMFRHCVYGCKSHVLARILVIVVKSVLFLSSLDTLSLVIQLLKFVVCLQHIGSL